MEMVSGCLQCTAFRFGSNQGPHTDTVKMLSSNSPPRWAGLGSQSILSGMFFCTQPGGHVDPLTGFHQAAGRDMEMRTVDLAPSEVVAVLIQGSSDHSAA